MSELPAISGGLVFRKKRPARYRGRF